MPDLLDKIDNIESSEKVSAVLQQKIDRLNELVTKQKRIIAEQSSLLERQKKQIETQTEIPDDVYELRELIGSQRAQINEKDIELVRSKSKLGEIQKELEHYKSRLDPTNQKLDGALDTIGKLKTEMAQKSSELLVKDETIKTLAGKIGQSEAFSKSLKLELDQMRQQQLDESSQFREKSDNEINTLKEQYTKEINRLKEELDKSSKDVGQAKELLSGDMDRLNKIVDNLSTWKTQNKDKISYFDKLSILMEQEDLFKTFLIVMEVGSIAQEDLQKALGAPIVLVKKYIEKLETVDLVFINDVGKINIQKAED